jgi:hypothetical protein
MIPQLPHPDAIGAVRARASLFRAVDHETLPAALLGLAAVVAALVALVAIDGRTHLADGATLTPQAWLALAAIAVLAVLGAVEVGAWLLSRRVGRDVARTVAGVEQARRRVDGLSVTRRDAALDDAATRIERAQRDLSARVTQLEGVLARVAGLPDERVRAAQLERIRIESGTIDRAAAAYSDAARVLRTSATSPWELSIAEAAAELAQDLDHAERLERAPR